MGLGSDSNHVDSEPIVLFSTSRALGQILEPLVGKLWSFQGEAEKTYCVGVQAPDGVSSSNPSDKVLVP